MGKGSLAESLLAIGLLKTWDLAGGWEGGNRFMCSWGEFPGTLELNGSWDVKEANFFPKKIFLC